MDERRDDSTRYALLASRLYYTNVSPEDRHMFVITADMAFSASERMRNVDAMLQLIDHACEAAKASLRERWTNCGCYYELPWVETLLNVTRGPASRSAVFPWSRLLELVDRLDENAAQNLLSGNTLLVGLQELRVTCQLLIARSVHLHLPPPSQIGCPVEESISNILEKTHFSWDSIDAPGTSVAPRLPAGTIYSSHSRDRHRRVRRLSTMTVATVGSRASPFTFAGYLPGMPPVSPHTLFHPVPPPAAAFTSSGVPFLETPPYVWQTTPSSIRSSAPPSRQGSLEQRGVQPATTPRRPILRDGRHLPPVTERPANASRVPLWAGHDGLIGTPLSPVIDNGSDVSNEPIVNVDSASASDLPSASSDQSNLRAPSEAPQYHLSQYLTSSPEVHPGSISEPYAPLLRPRSISPAPLPIIPPYTKRSLSSSPPTPAADNVRNRVHWQDGGEAASPPLIPLPAPRIIVQGAPSGSEDSLSGTELAILQDGTQRGRADLRAEIVPISWTPSLDTARGRAAGGGHRLNGASQEIPRTNHAELPAASRPIPRRRMTR